MTENNNRDFGPQDSIASTVICGTLYALRAQSART